MVLLERGIMSPQAPQSIFTISEEMKWRNGKTDEEVANKDGSGRILCSAKIR